MKRDWKIFPCILCVAMLAATAFRPAFADEKTEKGMIWPDESHTFMGITVTWKLPKGGIPTPVAPSTSGMQQPGTTPASNESESPLGQLEFKGPRTTLHGLNAPFLRQGSKYVRSPRMLDLYIDDIFLYLDGHVTPGSSYNIQVEAREYPSQRTIAGPSEHIYCYVSSICPLHLNDWTFTVSKEIKKFPDGSRAFELMAANTQIGQQTSFPLVKGAMRKIGRFQVSVVEVWKETKTARLDVHADADPNVPGHDALLQDGLDIKGDTTLEAILSQLAKKYHFNVEWVPYPDHPESVDFLKSIKSSRSFGPGSGMFGEWLSGVFEQWEGGNTARVGALHWVDNTHLQVLPENYDKYLAAQEEKKEKEASEKEAAEQRKTELGKFRKLFAEKYSPQTKIYKLDTLTPVTAKALVDSDLREYLLLDLPARSRKGGLVAKPDVESYRSAVESLGGSVCEEGESHLIVSWPPDKEFPPSIAAQRDEAREESIPDDKANALIVKAIPSTQEKIAALLDKMQKLASKESTEGPPPVPYRISAVLLQGVQSGESTGSATEAFPVRIKVAGVVKDIPAKVGETLWGTRVLVRLDPTTVINRTIEVDLEQLKRASSEQEKRPIENNIRAVRDQIERVQDNLAIAPYDPSHKYRVASIDVKPGDHVLAGQQVATLTWIRPETGPAVIPPASLSSDYGLGPEDLKTFGIANVSELGRGIVNLVPSKGNTGVARIALSSRYSLQLTYLDERKPYLIVKGTLVDDSRSHSAAKKTSSTAQSDNGNVLLENTMYLEPDKPSLLGITNLRQALILVVRRLDGGDSGGAKAGAAPASPGDVGSVPVK